LPLALPDGDAARFAALRPPAPSSSDEEEDEPDADDELETSLSLRTGLAGALSFFRLTPVSGSSSSELELVDDAGGLDAAPAAAARFPFTAAAGRARGAGRGLRMKKSSCANQLSLVRSADAHRQRQAVR